MWYANNGCEQLTLNVPIALTLALASSPRICSLGIQPSALRRSIQWPRMSALTSGLHFEMSRLWKPSSHRKPRGKKLLEEVDKMKFDDALSL